MKYKGLWQPVSLALVGVALVASLAGCGNQNASQATREIWGQVGATETDLISKIPGYIDEMYFKEGQAVKKGDILAHIDARQLRAKQDEVQAQVHAAQAQVAQAKASMDLALADLERVEKLYQADAVSRQLYDGARTKYEVAVATYNQALAGVNAYEHGVQQVVANIDDTYIKAPLDGVIATKYTNVGALVSSGMPIYGVQSTTDNWVDFKIPETMLDKFHLGQEVKIQGRNGQTELTGHITEISQKPDFATKRATSERGNATDIISYNVRVQVNDPHIFPGMRFKLLGYELPQGDTL